MLNPSSILIVNVTRIGDTLAATPSIAALHASWPLAKIAVLGGARRFDLIEHLPGVERVGSISKQRAPILGWFGKRYDLAIVYNYDESLVRYALRVARKVVAFRQKSEDINRRLYRCVEPDAYPTTHITEHFMRLPVALGVAPGNGRIRYRCLPDELDAARNLLQKNGFSDRRPLIGLQMASFPTKSYRDWPAESFLALTRKILERWPNAGFLIFGGEDEQKLTTWLKEQLDTAACLLAGQLSLRETAAVMSLSDMYIGVDTGPTHLMSSFDLPLVGLYHPRHPSISLGPKDHSLNFSLDHPLEGDLPDGQPHSMGDISISQVFAQVERGLATRGYV